MAFDIDLGTLLVELAGDDRDLSKALKRVKSELGEMVGVAEGFAKQIDEAITGAFEAAAVAVTAFGAASIKAGVDYDTAMQRVRTITGATGKELQALTDTAREIGRTTTFSAKDAADAMYVLAQAGLDTQEILSSVKDVLVLAGASGMDLERSANLVAAAMKTFNIPASQAGHIVDVFNIAAQNSLLSMQDVASAFKFGGVAGNSFNQTIETTIAALAQFRDYGLDASKAGTAYRASLSRLEGPATAAKKVLKDLTVDLKEVQPSIVGWDGAMKRLSQTNITAAQSQKLFGVSFGAAIHGVIRSFNDGRSTFDTMIDHFEKGAGSAEATFAQMQASVSGQFSLLKNKVSDILISVFEDMKDPIERLLTGLATRIDFLAGRVNKDADTITGAANTVVDAILNVVDALIRLSPYVKEIAGIMATMWAASKIVQLIPAVNALAAAFGVNLLGVLSDVTAAFVAMDAATIFLTGGAVLAIAAGLATLAFGIQTLYDELTGAADEAERLNAALEANKVDDAVIGAILKGQQDEIRARAMNGEQISEQEKAILALTDAQAKSGLQTGELVMWNGELTDATKLTTDQLKELATGYNLQAQNLVGVTNELDDLIRSYHDVGAGIEAINKGNVQNMRIYDEATQIVGHHVGSYKELLDAREQVAAQAQIEIDSEKGVANALAKASVAAKDAKGSLKDVGDQSGKTGDDGGKAAKKLEELRKKLEDMRAATDKNYAAWIKLQRALLEIDEAEQAGVDGVTVMKAREAAYDEFYDKVTIAHGAVIDFSHATETLNEVQAQATMLSNAWTAAIDQYNLAIEIGRDNTEALKEAQAAYDQSLKDAKSTTDDSSDAMQHAAGASDALAEGMGGIVGWAQQIAGEVGSQMLGFLSQFTDAIFGVTGAIIDLNDVLDFTSVFTDSANSLKDWKQQINEAQANVQDLSHTFDLAGSALDFVTSDYHGHGKTPKDRRKDRRNKIKDAKDAYYGAEEDLSGAKHDLTQLQANKPKSPQAAEAQAIADKIDWMQGFIKALPGMLKVLVAKLPGLLHVMVDTLVKAIVAMSKSFGPVVHSIIEALAELLQRSPAMIRAIIKMSTDVIYAMVDALPLFIKALVVAAPKIVEALIELAPQFIFAWFTGGATAFIAATIAALPDIAKATWNTLKSTMERLANHFLEIISLGFLKKGPKGIGISDTGLGGMAQDAWEAIKDAWNGVFHPHRHARGINYVPYTMASVLEPGESVLDRSATRALARGTFYPDAPVGTGPSGHAPMQAEVLVAFDGQVVDAAQFRAMEAGRMPKMRRAMRSGHGTKVGFRPSRLAFYD
jgi:TP901 family phage tail tape measure protein